MERTEGLEFSDVLGIRYECADCGAVGHYTLDSVKKLERLEGIGKLVAAIECPTCSALPDEMNLVQLGWVAEASVLLDAVHRLADGQSKEPKPRFKLSFEVRSKA